jgi:microcystin-dependent protein
LAKLILNGSTSGSITLESPAVSGTNTLTLPAATGTVMVNGPAFSAYLGSNQSITTSTFTKVQINTEEFDTNSNYDNATNYRFTPTVAGYYQVNGRFSSEVNSTLLVATIYKNGVEVKRGMDTRASVNVSTGATVNTLIYMNGTTDYIEFYAYITGTSPIIESGQKLAWFQASMVRGA